ncbi:betaine-aldehyde dehydrogenase [Legionella sp. W05-934-2]|jgi:betaine-aldehyde dehydrogenase|uniref:betaine-aldehyde dehydrogenase n=1 Tax=Legionella sp. W05-934-2 TaxID=1198649 RepID=UPI0034634BB8
MSQTNLQLFINGEYVDAQSQHQLTSYNPATNTKLYDFANANEYDVNRAVQAAKVAFAEWANTPPQHRARILRKTADLLRQNNEELSYLEALDTGKPIQETKAVDIATGADCLEYYASLAVDLSGQHIAYPSSFVYTRREPLGVCVGIGAWNYPLQIACWKSAPALACGNTMVFKPSENTPLTALKLAEIYHQAGLPNGVFNVVTGNGEAGTLLSRHPDVAKVSFTGSVPTGKKVMKNAADSLKHVTMELGGKSPLIIFEDADIEKAVSVAMLANFFSQGEVCCNGTRVFVHQSIYEAFLNRLRERVAKIQVGSPLDPNTQMGALISKEHFNKVMGYIDSGLNEGAKLLCGGQKIMTGGLAEGNFLQPTVFFDCHDDMRIVKEEIFGPVMAVLSFTEEDDVIQRANNTDYGLAAGVFTKDLNRAHRVIARLQAGTCWINNYNITLIEMPFGGYKQSGMGRENGTVTLDHYTQVKSVYVELGDIDCPFE